MQAAVKFSAYNLREAMDIVALGIISTTVADPAMTPHVSYPNEITRVYDVNGQCVISSATILMN